MADLTIRVPSEHLESVRDGLLHHYAGIADALHHAAGDHVDSHDHEETLRGHRRELADLEDALDQVGWRYEDVATGGVEITAHPEVLSDVLHHAVLDALDAFGEACSGYWRGRIGPAQARAALATLVDRFRLFGAVQSGEE
jgi:hypothetical protein